MQAIAFILLFFPHKFLFPIGWLQLIDSWKWNPSKKKKKKLLQDFLECVSSWWDHQIISSIPTNWCRDLINFGLICFLKCCFLLLSIIARKMTLASLIFPGKLFCIHCSVPKMKLYFFVRFLMKLTFLTFGWNTLGESCYNTPMKFFL